MNEVPIQTARRRRVHTSPSRGVLYTTGVVILIAVSLSFISLGDHLSEMLLHAGHVLLTFAGLGLSQSTNGGNETVDLSWHPSKQTHLNNLTAVVNGDGVYGFIYNSSDTLDELYGVYNWCNMPHVRKREYVKAPKEYELVFVEVVRLTFAKHYAAPLH
jgi:hypothetical protein